MNTESLEKQATTKENAKENITYSNSREGFSYNSDYEDENKRKHEERKEDETW